MDTEKLIPTDYAEWRECITVHCGIPLTQQYISERLTALSQSDKEETNRFRRIYGDHHLQSVLGWFQRAKNDVNPAEN